MPVAVLNTEPSGVVRDVPGLARALRAAQLDSFLIVDAFLRLAS